MGELGVFFSAVGGGNFGVGSFQFAAAGQDEAALKGLADFAIGRHYPDVKQAEQPYLALLEAVLQRQAELVAKWMGVGFIHGVMNTDNMSIAGETIDYGPCAFMEQFDPQKVYSSIDSGKRYAFSNQPLIAQWNLARFAECLMPLLEGDQESRVSQLTDILRGFDAVFEAARQVINADKLGLTANSEQAPQLMAGLEAQMQKGRMDMAEHDVGSGCFTPMRMTGGIFSATIGLCLYNPCNHQLALVMAHQQAAQ